MRSWFIVAFLRANIGGATESAAPPPSKPRVFVLTGIYNEPDDEKSLVEFLVYANGLDAQE